MDMFPTTAEVDIFPSTYVSNSIATTHCENVACLSRETVDDHIRVSVHTNEIIFATGRDCM